jgi:outer membrane protein assembly factor BamB
MNRNFPEQPHTSGQPGLVPQPAKRTRVGQARILGSAIALTIVLLAGAFTAIFFLGSTHLSAYASGGAPTPTPTVGTPAPGEPQPSGSLYAATPGSLTRIDLKTSKVLWTIQASYPSAPIIIGKTLFFENEDSTNPFLEAADAKTGTQIWSTLAYPNGFLIGTKNELYDSSCDFSTTGTVCRLYGINTSTGAQLWSYDLPRGDAWITVQNGVLYGVSYTSYFALNATTGAPLWQKDLLNYTDQEADMNPAVSGNTLSFASCNTTKQSSGFAGCYLYDFNASTGVERWHMATTANLEATPTIMNGVIYAGAIDGTVYALKAKDGTQIWSANAGAAVGQLLSKAGIVYVETIAPDGQTFHIEAFDAATQTPLWGQISDASQSTGATTLLAEHLSLSAGPASHPFVLDHGLIYLQNGPNGIAVLNTKDGSQVAQYTVSGTLLDGFAVVAQ